MDREKLEYAVKISFNKKKVLIKMGRSTRGGSYITLNKYLEKYDIDISHFKRVEYSLKIRPLEDILKNGTDYGSDKLKKRLFKVGILTNICSICDQVPFWNGNPMPLVLDHINGDNRDNRIENLRIVCRHCDCQLDTFCGRNKRRNKEPKFCGCGVKISYTNKSGNCFGCAQRLRFRKFKRKIKYCLVCSKIIDIRSKRCHTCSNKLKKQKRKVERPPHEQLIKEIKETSYCAVGRKYGVSDNAIRKWVKSYEKQ